MTRVTAIEQRQNAATPLRPLLCGAILLAGLWLGACQPSAPPADPAATPGPPVAAPPPLPTQAATATPLPPLTVTAQASANAGVQAQLTAVQATAETAATIATADAARVAAAQRVFRDSFADNRNGWFTGRFDERETSRIEEGVFKVTWEAQGSSYELYELQEFADFGAEVECVVVAGGRDGSCGLVFAQTPDAGYYVFEVFADYYRLARTIGGVWQTLAEGDPAGGFRPDAPNRLRVLRDGAAIRLYLNDQLLAVSADAALPAGRIGVQTGCYADQGGVEVWFDNFTIWELP